jgi:Immunoglobulin I-set domain/FG-GAP-like repeat
LRFNKDLVALLGLAVLVVGAERGYAQIGSDSKFFGEQYRPDLFRHVSNPMRTQLVDVDMDGDFDIVNVRPPNVYTFLNDGSGLFLDQPIESVLDVHAQFFGGKLTVGDLNLDGFPDLVLSGLSSGKGMIAFGDGTGRYDGVRLFGVARAMEDFVVHDFNGDGIMDMAVMHQRESAYATILWGREGGGFSDSQVLMSSQTIAFTMGMYEADIDGDTVSELIFIESLPGFISNQPTGQVVIFKIGSNGRFDMTPVARFFRGTPLYATASDLNQDGNADVLIGVRDGAVVFLGDGAGAVRFIGLIPFRNTTKSVTVRDMNYDRVPEAIFGGFTPNVRVVSCDWEDVGTARTLDLLLNPFANFVRVCVEDLDNDGKPDLFAIAGGRIGSMIYFNETRTPFVRGCFDSGGVFDEGEGPIRFEARVGGVGKLMFEWRKNGEPLEEDDLFSGVHTDTLTIRRAELEAEGEYDVVVRDETGETVSEGGVLAVRSAPRLLGDVNGDGVVDAKDVRIVIESFTKKKKKHDRDMDEDSEDDRGKRNKR